MKKCSHFEKQLTAYIHGELAARDQDALTAHLGECAGCRAELEAQRAVLSMLDDALETYGNRAVAHVPKLQKLLRHICANGFEHHVVMNLSHTAGVLEEAFGNYLGWDVHYHEKPED